MNAQEIERLKSEGFYYQAGTLAAALGHDDNYGCHYGLRCSRDYAVEQFKLGHKEASRAIEEAGR